MISIEQAWESLEKASELVGYASEADNLPPKLRDELLKALAAIVWTSQSIRCPCCGSWTLQ
jgi:hypothetical protein